MRTAMLKDPAALLDYRVDWSPWLEDGDTIVASTWAVPDGLTAESDSFTDTAAIVWLSGGEAGRAYEVVNHITTVGGREDERTLLIQCVNR